MKITYSPTADAIYIELNQHIPVKTKQINEQIKLDFDVDNNLIGIELLDASTYSDDPHSAIFELLTESERPDPEMIEQRRKAVAEARRQKKVKHSE
jgi:uncharacterized protein YuzE